MAKPYSAPMPEAMDLGGGYTIRLSAVDPVTGNVIGQVQIENLAMLVDTPAGSSTDGLGFGDFLLVPGVDA